MRQRSTATVFVDDYVQNRLPDICVITGEPTTDRLVSDTVVDRPSLGWLILLAFGPVGWIILLAVFALGQRSYLHGQLPLSEAAYVAERRRTRMAVLVGVGAIAAALLLLITVTGFAVGLAGMAVAVAIGIAVYLRTSSIGPKIDLDASRRFVEIRNVHPAFAAAIEERNRLTAWS